ncbi:ATP-binding protein [Streptomyces sp. NPDC005426]|uniref:ATP-binding protein n=1 Tax=Streptomyces sp. NPDC005426 TaxID=3155344 RepID=UPI0033B2AE23
MHAASLAALCPAVAETRMPFPDAYAPSARHRPPQPYLRPKGGSGRSAPRLSLSFTLPGDIRSAGIARTATKVALESHGLASYVWPVTYAVTELVSVTARMSPGRELYVILRHRDDAVRLLVWDQHPHHTAPDMAALCAVRRRRALWLLTAVVDDWGGEWGTCRAEQPQHGTKSWLVLPH